MKYPWLRLPIWPVNNIADGIVTRAMTDSSGEIQIIIETIATTVMSAVSNWLIVCCRDWATLSMSLVARLNNSPRGWVSR
jgi:hypothetical protein